MKHIKCKLALIPFQEGEEVSDILIYKKIRDIRGNYILDPRLETSTNPTFIRNVLLIDSGLAATNAQTKYTFYHLYVLSPDKIENKDWWMYTDLEGRYLFPVKEDHESRKVKSDSGDSKIIFSTNPSLSLPKIPEKVVEQYCTEENKFAYINIEGSDYFTGIKLLPNFIEIETVESLISEAMWTFAFCADSDRPFNTDQFEKKLNEFKGKKLC